VEKPLTKTQTLRAIIQGENWLEKKTKEAYVQDPFIQHRFKKLHEWRKMKGITLKEGLLKWKQFWIYVLIGKLCTKIVQEEHDMWRIWLLSKL
jgi:ribosomal protein L32E